MATQSCKGDSGRAQAHSRFPYYFGGQELNRSKARRISAHTGDLLIVDFNYNEDTKEHLCKIEKIKL